MIIFQSIVQNIDAKKEINNLVHPYQGGMTEQMNDRLVSE